MTDEPKKNPKTDESDKKASEAKSSAASTKEESKKEKPETKPSSTKLPAKLQKIVDEIEKLSVLEVADLVKALEDKFGVTAATPVATAPVAAGAGEAAPGAAAIPEKTEFDVVLASAGANKIAVIKAVREVKQDLGLKEAKDFVEKAPQKLLEAAKKEDAEEAKKKLEAAGAQVELK